MNAERTIEGPGAQALQKRSSEPDVWLIPFSIERLKISLLLQCAIQVRNRASAHSQLFEQGVNDWDMAVIKDTAVRENVKVGFGAKAFNTFYRVQFSPPNLNINSSAFGAVSEQQNASGTMQFGLQVKFRHSSEHQTRDTPQNAAHAEFCG